ncbi:MAG: hypothetical protein PHP53_17055 [Prolixibacteraceae bacterium]|nr:hypothetical protein [Prolixibacteraceae bacterium]
MVMPRPHPNKIGYNVVMTGRRDSSFHFVSFGMTGSFEENVWAGRQSRPAQTPVKLAIVIPNEVRDLS